MQEDAKAQGSRSASQPARWAFLSDTHIAADPENNYRSHYPYRNLEKAFAQIASDLPEGIVVTGDIARLTGQMGDYENFRKLLMPSVSTRPIYLALGNHDSRTHFLDVFETAAGQAQAVKGKHIVTVDAGPARFVLLDSLFLTNETPGLLGKVQRTWLQRYLQTCDDKPVILFFHHSLRDEDGELLDAPRLLDLIQPIAKVKALVYGHSHEYAFSDHKGMHLIDLPASATTSTTVTQWAGSRCDWPVTAASFILHAVGGNREIDGRVTPLHWRS